MEVPPNDSLEKMQAAIPQVRALAIKIAPMLKDLKAELARDRVNQKDRTASYILLLAAAGFLVDEVVDRRIAAPMIGDVAGAISHDLIPGHRF